MTLCGLSPISEWNDEGYPCDAGASANLLKLTDPGGMLFLNGKFGTAPGEVMTPYFSCIRANVMCTRYAESSPMAFREEIEESAPGVGQFLANH